MSAAEIKEYVENQILQAFAGSSVENNKFEFKRQWYDLRDDEDINEFLKDATALVNSYGGSDAFLVIGVDEKNKTLIDSPLSSSGLVNDSELIGLIKRRVDRAFNLQVLEQQIGFDQNKISTVSIIHLHPSLDKPHVIRQFKKGNTEYLNEIFVRKDKTCERASRTDLDLMYAEKPTLQVERKAVVTFRTPDIRFVSNYDEKKLFLKSHMTVENIGFRAFAINTIALKINGDTPFKDQNAISMPLHTLVENHGFFPVIKSGDIERFSVTFWSTIRLSREDNEYFVEFLNKGLFDKTTVIDPVRIMLSTGDVLFPTVTFADY